MSWCKKNKYQLQKPEKKKPSMSTGKYTKTKTSNTKTVTPSSRWSSASSSKSLLHKNKIPSQVNKSKNLNKYFDLLNDTTEITSFRVNNFYLVDICGF